MWSAKLKINHKDCPIVSRAKKFGVNILSQPGKHFNENGIHKVRMGCRFLGDEKTREAYLADLRADKQLADLEVDGDHFIYEYDLGEEGEMTSKYYNEKLSITKPTYNCEDNHEYWEVSSLKKTYLKEFFDSLTGNMDKVEVLRVVEKDFSPSFYSGVSVDLSEQQRKAFELALQNGYYNFPRKVNLGELAGKMEISTATFQEHLRKAEGKIFSSSVLF